MCHGVAICLGQLVKSVNLKLIRERVGVNIFVLVLLMLLGT